jgi:hypothetical protein
VGKNTENQDHYSRRDEGGAGRGVSLERIQRDNLPGLSL